MRQRLFTILLGLLFIFPCRTSAQGTATGNTTLTVRSASSGTILAGCTVDANNNPTCPLPSGWTKVIAQGFEGTVSSVENIGGTITTNKSHSGSKSLMTFVSYDQAVPVWNINEGVTGSFTSIYLSYWEWADANAAANDEWELGDLRQFDANGNFQQEDSVSWLGYAFNTLTPTMSMGPQSPVAGGNTTAFFGLSPGIAAGSWHQWEMQWTPNTSGQSDGSFQIWRDGQSIMNVTGANLNGTLSMTGAGVQAGGAYTKLLWTQNGGLPPSENCTPLGTGYGQEYQGGGASFSAIAALCAPPAPSFNRYIDDIIVLKK